MRIKKGVVITIFQQFTRKIVPYAFHLGYFSSSDDACSPCYYAQLTSEKKTFIFFFYLLSSRAMLPVDPHHCTFSIAETDIQVLQSLAISLVESGVLVYTTQVSTKNRKLLMCLVIHLHNNCVLQMQTFENVQVFENSTISVSM